MKTLTESEKLALHSIHNHHLTSARQMAICFDVLIPRGYIHAEGTWYLTAKGIEALKGFWL